MTKVKITREQEESVLALTHGCNKEIAIRTYLDIKNIDHWKDKLEWLDFNLLLELLVNGYEVEETVEDKLLKLYNSNPINGCEYNEGYADGMVDSLDILKIKIKGIND